MEGIEYVISVFAIVILTVLIIAIRWISKNKSN
jgi:hypothetical protein